MKSRLVLYHGDCGTRDGFTSAWLAWKKFGDADTEYRPVNYYDPVPDVTGREVLIFDFAYPREALITMHEAAASLEVHDHHQTSAEKLAGLPYCHFDMAKSGARLAWDALKQDHPLAPEDVEPWLVRYVEDADLYRFALKDSREINAWIAVAPADSFADWNSLFCGGEVDACYRGMNVLRANAHYVNSMKRHARMAVIAGHRVPFVNAPHFCVSDLLHELSLGQPFAVAWSQCGDGMFKYSLRSNDDGVDVAEIAKAFPGGGGHRNAASFTLNKQVFGIEL